MFALNTILPNTLYQWVGSVAAKCREYYSEKMSRCANAHKNPVVGS